MCMGVIVGEVGLTTQGTSEGKGLRNIFMKSWSGYSKYFDIEILHALW